MTFDEMKVLVKGMKSVYTSDKFLPDVDAIKIWYQMLKDLDYKTCSLAVQKYMLTNKFPPTIAEIREMSVSVSQVEIEDWGKGWEKARNAIRKYGSYREFEALESMDDVTRQCVERLGYKELCMSEEMSVDRANFRMIYEQIAERNRQDAQIPTNIKKLIQKTRMQMIENSNHLDIEDKGGKDGNQN